MSDSISSTPDNRLLKQFARTRDEALFEELVRRHGRLVMSVCLRVLGNKHDAEDAFQATFLVLAQKCRKIKKREALPSWLCGVAYRLSMNLARKHHRKDVALASEPMSSNDQFSDLEQRFDQQVIDEELHSLPAKYRDALILHYLDGQSSREIAESLGTSQGTIDGRIKRGRQELRVRLAKRGVAFASAIAAVHIGSQSAAAAVAPSLVASTVAAAAQPLGLCSRSIVELAGTELMKASLLKPGLAMCAAVALLGVTTLGLNAAVARATTGQHVLDTVVTQDDDETAGQPVVEQDGQTATAVGVGPKASPLAKELAKLDGVWVFESQIIAGKPVEEEVLAQFKGARVVINNGLYVKKGGTKVSFDPSTSPGSYSTSHPDMEGFHGLYKLDGDSIVICRNYTNQPKPTDFSSTKQNGQHLLVYKKAKQDKTAQGGKRQIQTFVLRTLPAKAANEAVQRVLPSLKIEADEANNRLLMSGTQNELDDAKQLLRQIEPPVERPRPPMRVPNPFAPPQPAQGTTGDLANLVFGKAKLSQDKKSLLIDRQGSGNVQQTYNVMVPVTVKKKDANGDDVNVTVMKQETRTRTVVAPTKKREIFNLGDVTIRTVTGIEPATDSLPEMLAKDLPVIVLIKGQQLTAFQKQVLNDSLLVVTIPPPKRGPDAKPANNFFVDPFEDARADPFGK